MINQAKLWYLQGKNYISHLPEWTKERELIACETCFEDCKFRNRKERLPSDAGGECQCLRYAKEMCGYAFKNSDGRVVIIPPEIIRQIVSDVVEELKK